jgi:hypothetical protein
MNNPPFRTMLTYCFARLAITGQRMPEMCPRYCVTGNLWSLIFNEYKYTGYKAAGKTGQWASPGNPNNGDMSGDLHGTDKIPDRRFKRPVYQQLHTALPVTENSKYFTSKS